MKILKFFEIWVFFRNFRFLRNFAKFSIGYSNFGLIKFISVRDFILVRHSGFKIIIIGRELFYKLALFWSFFWKIPPRRDFEADFHQNNWFFINFWKWFLMKMPNFDENSIESKGKANKNLKRKSLFFENNFIVFLSSKKNRLFLFKTEF